MTAPATLSRVARAVHLDAERLGALRWRVWGGAREHVVDVARGRCDCADFRLRGHECKHLLRARLGQGDAETLALLRELVPAPKRGAERTVSQ